MVLTVIILVYNTEWKQYHGRTVNYHCKKFYNIGPRCQERPDSNSQLWGGEASVDHCAAANDQPWRLVWFSVPCMYHTWYFHSLMTSAFWRQNILRHFTRSAPPLLYSWSNSPIGCSAPLYSRSSFLIGSAYYFLYISFCFRFNKSLTNLTSSRQHHLQYTWKTIK